MEMEEQQDYVKLQFFHIGKKHLLIYILKGLEILKTNQIKNTGWQSNGGVENVKFENYADL